MGAPLNSGTGPNPVSRRQYFRVDLNLPLRVRGRAGTVKNLSGNGLLAVVPHGLLAVGERYDVEFGVPGIPRPVIATARVVRISPGAEDLVGMAFDALTARTRENLVRFIFCRQRELLRRHRKEPLKAPPRRGD